MTVVPETTVPTIRRVALIVGVWSVFVFASAQEPQSTENAEETDLEAGHVESRKEATRSI